MIAFEPLSYKTDKTISNSFDQIIQCSMRIFLPVIFLLLSSALAAQKPVVSVIPIKKGSKFQFVNKQTGAALDNSLWDDVESFVNGFAQVYRNNKSSLVNSEGKLIAPLEFDGVMNFSNKLCAVKKGGKWGFIDVSGRQVIPCNYDIVFDFSNPLVTVVNTNKKWFLVNRNDVKIKQLDITCFYGFENGVAKVIKKNKEGLLHTNGTITWGQANAVAGRPISWHPNQNNLAAPCPDNITFEFGDFTNWECFTGDVSAVGNTNVITVLPSPPTANRHTIIPRSVPAAQDPWGFFDINAPDGSNFIARLGGEDPIPNHQAERIRYAIHVPVNDSTFSIKYDYAVVLQSPGHQPWEQPRFISRLIDSATGNPVNCASFEYVATAGLPGFKVSPRNSAVLYKDWSSVFYSLRGYGGKTLYLEFTTGDCTFTAHWGYAYIDVENTCGSPVEIHYECLAPHQMTLTAPPGFQTYNWWNSNFTTLLGTGQQLNMNPGLPIGSYVWVDMIPFNNFGCRDTLLVKLDGTFDAQFDMTQPVGCAPQTYTFYNRNIPSVSVNWNFGDGNTASGDTVTHTYNIPGPYNVVMNVTTPGGCTGNAIHLVTIYPPPDMVKPADQVFCNRTASTAINFTGTPGTVVFNWTNSNPSIGIPASGTGNILSFNPINTGTTPVTATITVVPTFLTCTGPPKTFTITVNPSPDLTPLPASQIVCNGQTTTAVSYTGTLGGTTFTWTNNIPSIGLPASGTGNVPAFVANNIGPVPVTANITITPSNGTCPGMQRVFQITVNPAPNVVQPANVSVCNNSIVGAINFTGAVFGTTFSWTNSDPSIGLAASGNGNIPSFVGINNSNVPVTAIITVTPSANGCTGAPAIFTITLNPIPNVFVPANLAVCNGLPTGIVNFTGSVGTTSFNWTNSDPSIGLAANGTGDIPSFTAINTTNAPVTATITVTPLANGCPGPAQNFTITVNPTPDMVVPNNETACNNGATNAISFTSSVSGTTFPWSNNNTSIGLAGSGTGNIPSFTAINASNTPVTAIITIAPIANGCQGPVRGFTITVYPTPDVVQSPNQVLCNGSTTGAINFTGNVSGTSFNWSNNNPSVGLAASGTGNIPSFTAINTTNAPVTATITVTPLANGCTGVAKSFDIIVNPTPDVVQPANQAVCNGSATNAVNYTGSVSGTSFAWTNDNPSIGLAANGTGDLPSFTATNTTNAPVTATIAITPSANNCIGPVQFFTITVNPTPVLVKPADQVLCNNATTNAVNFTGAVSGTGFSWTNDNTSIGLAASGTGNIPSFNAINTTNTATIANIITSPSANGCAGPPQSFTITVNPTPDVVQPTDQRICEGFSTNAINFSGSVSGTSFNWTNNAPSIGLAASGIGNISSFRGINPGPDPVNAAIIITPSAKGCTGSPKTVVVRVDPNPIIDLGKDLNLSTGTVTNMNATIQNGPIANWAWTPATGLSCTDCSSPALTVSNNISYNVVVTNIHGCVARDNISISTFCKESQVFVPNAFTPNADGLNDILMVRGKGIFVLNFRIFNRWGELVFQKTNFKPNDTQYGWDGKVKGILANPDVFVFTAEVVCDNGIKYTYKGNSTLLR